MTSKNALSADNQQERLKLTGWIVGFTDGEGCFLVSVNRNRTSKLGWQVMPEFVLTQSEKSIHSLKFVQKYFGCGRIYVNRRHDNHIFDLYRYCVRSLRDLNEVIIPFFKKNHLLTDKQKSFQMFAKAVELMTTKKAHLNFEGIHMLAKISSQMNNQKSNKFLESSETIRRGSK